MIFLGDVAHPLKDSPHWAAGHVPWESQLGVVNLEGSITEDQSHLSRRCLFNHPSVLEGFERLNIGVVLMANNHVMDLPSRLDNTRHRILGAGMIPIGAGTNRSQAERRALVHERGEEIRILNFGWRPIGCPPVADGRPGTNTMGPKHVLSSVYRQKEDSPTSSLVCIVHWNYEMELYPQPAHRQLAFAMIDAGADLVVGHHPHRVGGYEVYRGKPIVYSLGNFWLPHGYFFNGKLAFAPDANLGLALEWHPSTTPIAHWFQYEPDTNHLSSIGSEPMQLSEELATRTPFMGLDHARYQRWFRENRTKKRILPIYKDMDHELRNHARDALVKARHQALVGLEASGLRRLLGI